MLEGNLVMSSIRSTTSPMAFEVACMHLRHEADQHFILAWLNNNLLQSFSLLGEAC